MAKIKLKQGIDKVIRDFKIYFRLNFIYPASEKNKKIKSILPSSVISVGDNVVIEKDVDFGRFLDKLETGLYIGNRTIISYCKKIGKYTSISYDVKIGLVAHPLDFISTSPLLYAKRRGWVEQNLYDEQTSGFTEIGHDVLISANVVILSGVKIGNGAVIGAGSIVNKDVPPYAIVGGVPGKILRYRFSEEIIETLERVKWWDMDKTELLKLSDKFADVKEFIKKI